MSVMRALAILLAISSLEATPTTRRYNTSGGPQPSKINIHILAHSHDDVGWLKSAQEYYDGAQVLGLEPYPELSVYYANGAVQFTISSVVAALLRNPDRKFVIVEQWFFQRWWRAASAYDQANVRSLVVAGQLIFANGGLVMHDEACPDYIAMLDQTSAGIRWLSDTLGPAALPRVTSQLDPFGHSATQASLFASPLSGYIAQFHARMDCREKDLRHAKQTMDFAWAPSRSLGLSALTMGSLGNFGYSSPDGFCFDVSIECQAESAAIISPSGLNQPINDDAQLGLPDAIGDNVLVYMAKVLETVEGMRGSYPTDADGTQHLPVTLGDDFWYTSAEYNFASIDKLIHYVNANATLAGLGYNMFYSNQALYASARLGMSTPLSLKTSDAMPYASEVHQVWSGYFTSRPAFKGYVRESTAWFTAARQLQAWAAPPADTGPANALWLLEQGLGVAQHHDAISGTAKQTVTYDYARRVQAGRDAAGAAMSLWLDSLLGLPEGAAPPAGWVACELANASICALTETAGAAGAPVALVLHNARGIALTNEPVRVPVVLGGAAASWQVLAGDGLTQLLAQLVPASPADLSLRVNYYGVPAANMSTLAFFAPSVPAAGWAVVFLVPVATAAAAPLTHESVVTSVAVGTPAQLTNGVVNLSFDAAGLLASFASTAPGSLPSAPLHQSLLYYSSNTGDAADDATSGAYVFRPNASQSAYPVAPAGAALTLLTGPVVCEAWQAFGPWASQAVRLWSNASDGFDLSWTLGPLPTGGPQGVEVVSRLATGWASAGAFETDANCREWQLRQRNARPDYNYTDQEPVAANFYPVNCAIRVVDGDGSGASLTVITDRTQAGASLVDGAVELMLHRRLTADDGKGVMETLSEPGVDGHGLIARGVHRILVAPAARAAPLHRAAQQAALQPLLWRGGVLPAGFAPAAWAKQLPAGAAASLLVAPLPANVQLVTLHAYNATTALLRLGHAFEAGENAALSANVSVALASLFSPPALAVRAATEMTLTGGQPLADVAPVTYTVAGVGAVTLPVVPPPPAGAELVITLAPMQIRTFLVTLAGPQAPKS